MLHVAPAGDGRVAVITETTSFHPVDAAWPDQPADAGVIRSGAGEFPVRDAVVAATDGEVLHLGADIPVRKGTEGWAFVVAHLVDEGAAIAEGDEVEIEADAATRRALSAGHTACHLAALALNRALADRWSKPAREDALGSPDFDGAAIASSRIVPNGSVDRYRLNKSLRRAGFDTASLPDDLDGLAARGGRATRASGSPRARPSASSATATDSPIGAPGSASFPTARHASRAAAPTSHRSPNSPGDAGIHPRGRRRDPGARDGQRGPASDTDRRVPETPSGGVTIALVGIHIEKVDLPGIGIRHDLVTEGGRRISVVSHRDGERDLGVFDVDDPDACRDSIPLNDDEAAALADVLGASVMLSRLTSLSDETAGLYTEQIALPTDSPYLNRTLGDTKARTRTHASIVAIVRDKEIIPSPTPAEPLRAGDVIVAVGTREGLDGVARLLANGPG